MVMTTDILKKPVNRQEGDVRFFICHQMPKHREEIFPEEKMKRCV